MGKSHLYWGFRYVGVLKSILSQRNIQSFLLKQCSNALLRPGAFLSVGTAFGEELAYFAQEGALDLWDTIVGIDIVGDVEEHVLSQPSLSSYSERLSFEELDLINLPSPFGEGYWHCIQCGFVLEDIEYANKQSAYDKLFQSLHDGGGLIISEMFVDNQKRSNGTDDLRRQQMSDLYDYFLAEARDCFVRKCLTQDQYNLLCGTGQEEGLLLTKKMAIKCERDYFETREQTEAHLRNAGFSDISYQPNPVFPLLGVIAARKRK